ncbi:glycolate oxidase 3 isoform X1 [Hyalella azteca]|uniref:(S)-2-hydroxy-acid oxidase n=1 Tax=Hyalella azteca TaxID=294128 RepID=A0A8B7NGT5_HYAAZ|nr:glycolate oxidase 3 isoform X1 [Hyalella azteca]
MKKMIAEKSKPSKEEPPVDGRLVCVQDFATAAAARLPLMALDYYRSGATSQVTLIENRRAMRRWYILPRLLRDVSTRSLGTSVFGHSLQLPIAIAPTALQKMAHPLGECASASAAGRHGTVFTLSTIATSSIEEVARSAPNAIKFFQLYIYRDRSLTEKLVERAKAAGFKAIVLTVDAATFGIRRADIRNNFNLPPHLKLANFESTSDEGTLGDRGTGNSGINEYVKDNFDAGITWQDLKWLINVTTLPVVVKGILTSADASLALQAGVAAVWVSNHGARQVDGVPPTIEALPHVVAEVNGRCPVFVDGGFTDGSDIFKALALGASLVFIGRPVLWGLACAGEQGVYQVIEILKRELDNVMTNSGCRTLSDITRDMVVRRDQFSKL